MPQGKDATTFIRERVKPRREHFREGAVDAA